MQERLRRACNSPNKLRTISIASNDKSVDDCHADKGEKFCWLLSWLSQLFVETTFIVHTFLAFALLASLPDGA